MNSETAISRSLKVIRCCANRRGTYDFPLALTSNFTSIFNRFWDITPSLHIHTTPLFQVELEKNALKYVHDFWRQDAQYTGLSNHKLKSALTCTVWSQCTPVPHRRTDRRTNITAIAWRFVLTNPSRAKKLNFSKIRYYRNCYTTTLC